MTSNAMEQYHYVSAHVWFVSGMTMHMHVWKYICNASLMVPLMDTQRSIVMCHRRQDTAKTVTKQTMHRSQPAQANKKKMC